MKYLLYILKLPSQQKGFGKSEPLTACVELSPLHIVISATRGFEWTVGKNFTQVKKWIEEKQGTVEKVE